MTQGQIYLVEGPRKIVAKVVKPKACTSVVHIHGRTHA